MSASYIFIRFACLAFVYFLFFVRSNCCPKIMGSIFWRWKICCRSTAFRKQTSPCRQKGLSHSTKLRSNSRRYRVKYSFALHFPKITKSHVASLSSVTLLYCLLGYQPCDPQVICNRVNHVSSCLEELKQLASKRCTDLEESRQLWAFLQVESVIRATD